MSFPGSDRTRFVFLGYLAAFGAAVLSGLMPSISKPILQNFNPLFFAAIVSIAPVAVFTPVSIRSKENKHIRRWGYVILAISAVIGSLIAPYAYFAGVHESAATDAALLANGEMVFTILVASLFFGERLSRRGFLAITLLVIGIVVVITDLNFSSSILNITAPGHILILCATLLWGVDNNVTSLVAERVDVARIIQIKSIVGGVGLLGVSFLAGAMTIGNTAELVYVIIFGLVVYSGSAFLSVQSLKRLGAITTTITFPISSVLGLIFAFILLHEPVTVLQIGSVAVIILGIYLLTRKGSVVREGIVLEQF
jgi:drug/metabolite transporter (DMT)-like permease